MTSAIDKLVVNPAEAATVKHIYERYLELGSVRLLRGDLQRREDRLQSPGVAKTVCDRVAGSFRAGLCTRCCRTRSTSAKFATKRNAIQGSTSR